MPLNTWNGITDFAIGPRLQVNSPFTHGPFTVAAGQVGNSIEVVMLIDPTDAADPTKSGSIEQMWNDAGVWRASGNKTSWVGGPHLLKDRAGNDMDPPRPGISFPVSEVRGKTIGIRGTINADCRIGLGHRFT